MILIFVVLAWLVIGIIPYGMILGVFTEEFPHFNNIGPAIFGLFTGPVGLIAALIFCGIIGRWAFRLVPYTYDQRLAEFMKDYAILGKEYFDKYDA